MAKKLDPIDLKQIVRLHLEGLSNREIGKTLGIGRNAVNNYVQLFKSCDMEMESLLELEPSAIKELFSNKTTINN
ncbi:MAG: hypothetical protein B6D61_11275 [Bacteroidetes bacterium 4484_249]|nr:MAG: hypothetical protein B6D61_11275 [Bacteroidetes bacterium 4484_249]